MHNQQLYQFTSIIIIIIIIIIITVIIITITVIIIIVIIIIITITIIIIIIIIIITPWLMKSGGLMPRSQALSVNPYPEPNQRNSSYWYLFR